MSKSNAGRRKAGLASLATTALVMGACVAGAGAASANTTFKFERVAGHSRYDTSVEIAKRFGNSANAILASGETGHYADALSANYLAGALNAPILLTQRDTTPANVLAQLKANGVKNLTIVGGPLAVSDAQEQALKADFNVTRVQGQTRTATNAAVVQKAGTAKSSTALIATGYNFPDALGAGPLAFHEGMPVGTTNHSDMPDDVIAALKGAGVNKAVVLGGPLAVPQSVVDELNSKGITVVDRLQGSGSTTGRSGTAAAVAEYAVKNFKFTVDHVDAASGRAAGEGADALSAGPLAGRDARPLLITETENVGGAALNYLKAHANTLQDGRLYGGPLAISDALKAQMENAAQQVTSNQSYSVTPNGATTVNTATGHNTTKVTFSGISASKVDLRLINCSAETTDQNGQTSFADTTPSDDKADFTGNEPTPADAQITEINGVSSSYGPEANGVNVQNGTVTATVTTTGAGCYQLVAFEDKNSDGALNLDSNNKPTEPFATTGQITAVAIDGVTVDGGNNVVTPYGSYTATAQLTQNGKPVKLAGIPVQFQVTNNRNGNVQEQTVTTDANGVATYQLSATDPNTTSGDSITYTVKATADANQDGTFGAGDPSGTQTVQFSDAAASATTVTIEGPASRTALEGNPQTVTAKVTDQYGNAVAGVPVKFTATDTDSNPAGTLSGTSTTDANGEATFTYTRNTDATDTVEAAFTAPGAQSGPTDTADTTIQWSAGVATVNGVDYSSLQDAIDNASSGDTITASGAFTGAGANATVVNKAVTLKGTNGATYDGTIVVQNTNGATVTGFNITPESYQGTVTGIYLDNAQNTTISNNTVTGADSTSLSDNGVGVINTSGGSIEQANITGNTFKNLTQGVFANPSADFTETGNTFTNNVAGSANDAPSTVTNNTFTNNDQGVGTSVAGMTITGNTFTTDAPTTDVYVDATGAPVSSAQLNSWLASNTYNPAAKVEGNKIVATTHP